MAEQPTVTSRSDIVAHELEAVRVVGVYRQVDVRRRPTATPRYDRHVALELEDGTRVLLEPVWAPESRRDRREIARFEGREVAAIGILHPVAPDSLRGRPNLPIPCLTEVSSVAPLAGD